MAGAGFKTFGVGDVLTASDVNTYLMQQSVMVFADAAARNTALGTAVGGGNALSEGMVAYLADSDTVQVYTGTDWTGVSKMKKVAAFTSSGTWTVPAGVTYAIAHMVGAGGGGASQTNTTATDGGSSSVVFAGGTAIADGGPGADVATGVGASAVMNPADNSGLGGYNNVGAKSGGDGAHIVEANTVTPGASITVTVGSGGTGSVGTNNGTNGADGYVWIEYYE